MTHPAITEMAHPVIRKLEFFGPLADEDRALVLKVIVPEIKVPAQTDLIREGDDPTIIHLFTSGFGCRYKQLEHGKRQIVAFLIPGDFADPQAFLLDKMDHSISTLAPSKVVRVPQKAMLEMMERPALARALFIASLADSATLREWIATIGQRNGAQRIAHLFCEITARLRAVGMVSDAGVVRLPITQTQLSEAVGLSVVHTNRSLQELKAQGFVSFAGGNLQILDAEKLELFGGFTSNYLHLK